MPEAGAYFATDLLLAFDLADGHEALRVPLGTHGDSLLRGHDGALYLGLSSRGTRHGANGTVEVRRFDASLGAFAWTRWLAGYAIADLDPLPGQVLVGVAGFGYTSLRVKGGEVAWTVPGAVAGAATDGEVAYLSFQAMLPQELLAVHSSSGIPLWAALRPWQEARACPPVVAGGLVLLHGFQNGEWTENGTAGFHVAAYGALDGREAWRVWVPLHSSWVGPALSCAYAAATRDAFFAAVDADDGGMDEQAFRLTDGRALWSSPHAAGSVVVQDGVLVGLGEDPLPDLEWDWGQAAWLALDAGAGVIEGPQPAFSGPTELHRFDVATFTDRTTPGVRPILARHWTLLDADGPEGDALADGFAKDFELEGGAYGAASDDGYVQRLNVTLTVMDDQYHVASASRVYRVLPDPPQQAPPLNVAFLPMALAAMAAWRRR
jgi:hypothetical protein